MRMDDQNSRGYLGEESFYNSEKVKNDMWPQNNNSDNVLYPGEEHYYADGKLRLHIPFYRQNIWKITTVVALAVIFVLLSFIILKIFQQPTQSSANSTSGKSVSVFTTDSTWQGTYYQHDNVGNYQTPLVLHIDNIHGTKFSGTTTESAFDNAITADEGSIINNVNSLSFPDQQRIQMVINRYGNAGTLIMYTDPYQQSGSAVAIHARLYALVGLDGTLHGVNFNPDHDPSDLTPDGDFTLDKKV